MAMSIAQGRRHLATLWFAAGGILFAILLLQTILGRYGERAPDAWSWMLPTVLPTLSLVVGVLVMEARGHGSGDRATDPFLFRLAYAISGVYLLSVLAIIVLKPFTTVSPFVLMNQSSLWLGPFQGLVSAVLGAFFVNVPVGTRGDAPAPPPRS